MVWFNDNNNFGGKKKKKKRTMVKLKRISKCKISNKNVRTIYISLQLNTLIVTN